jgi:PhoPQ-activated pathogenicity-related protein
MEFCPNHNHHSHTKTFNNSNITTTIHFTNHLSNLLVACYQYFFISSANPSSDFLVNRHFLHQSSSLLPESHQHKQSLLIIPNTTPNDRHANQECQSLASLCPAHHTISREHRCANFNIKCSHHITHTNSHHIDTL